MTNPVNCSRTIFEFGGTGLCACAKNLTGRDAYNTVNLFVIKKMKFLSKERAI